jgi:hypothetical protein
MSPEDSGEFGRYCHYRRSEDEVSVRLRLGLSGDEAGRFEKAYLEAREARAA